MNRRGIPVMFILLLIAGLLFGSGFVSGENGVPRDEIIVVAPAEERFDPDAENWRIPFALVSTAPRGGAPPVRLTAVMVDGAALDLKQVAFLEGNSRRLPVIMAGRHLPADELIEWNRIRSRAGQRAQVTAGQASRFAALTGKISSTARKKPELARPSNEIVIPAGLFPVRENNIHEVTVAFQTANRKEEISFTTAVTVTALPGYPGNSQWVGGDLHIHSTYSDGQRTVAQLKTTMKDRGYHFVYLTDHINQFLSRWAEYRQAVYGVSDAQFSMFPGTESKASDGGHLVVHGIKNLLNLEESLYTPQQLINNAAANDPAAPSSSAIAHPVATLRWKDYTVSNHSGIEIMSGPVQLFYDLNSGPAKLWRQEIMRLHDLAASGGRFPSPRTATDWHGFWFEPLRHCVTWVYLPDYWSILDYEGRKSLVDAGLARGEVVASRRGSLGIFTLAGSRIGSVKRNVPAGTSLPLEVEFRSTRKGTITVSIFRNNLAETVFQRSASCNVGDTLRWQSTVNFPGGRQIYWLYAEGPDYVYSSPIYVCED